VGNGVVVGTPSKVANVVFDCENPQAQAEFWAGVLGYPRPAWPDELVAGLRGKGATQQDLDSRSVAVDPGSEGPRLYFQKVPEGKVVKNRVHLDVASVPGEAASPEEVDAEKDRIVSLGATVLRKTDARQDLFGEYYYVMLDPEGNEFCVT